MQEEHGPAPLLARDENGSLILPPNKKMFWSEQSIPLYSSGDGLWALLTESELPPFEALRRFSAEVREVDPEDLDEFLAHRHYFTDPGAILARAQAEDAEEAWLDAPIRVDLGLTVDADFEYTLNTTYPAYMGSEYDEDSRGLFKQSSIMWLTRRQGHKQKDLRDELYDDRDTKSPFLRSARSEIVNEMSTFNQLAFLVQLPLRELLLLKTMERWGRSHHKWPGYVRVSTETVCGFIDSLQGSCSCLGIRLERPVKLPLNVLEIWPDGASGYAIGSVFDYDKDSLRAFWKPDCIEHWGLPRKFRRDAAALGVTRLPPSKHPEISD